MLKLYENIRERREELGWSQQQLADKVGYANRASVAKVESGVIDLSHSKILEFADALRVPATYLMGWADKNGNPLSDNTVDITNEVYRLPVVGTVRGGTPIYVCEDIIDYINVSKEWSEGYFGLKVKGNSMYPQIVEGSTVIVKQTSTVNNGSIAVVAIGNEEATIKQVFINEKGITLKAFNEEVFSPKSYSPKEVEELPIWIMGEVVEERRRF